MGRYYLGIDTNMYEVQLRDPTRRETALAELRDEVEGIRKMLLKNYMDTTSQNQEASD